MSQERIIDREHNQPPELVEIIAQEQAESYAEKLKEIDRMIEKETTVPDQINDDEASGKASDFVKLAKATVKEAENIRLAERKKYTVKSDAVQSFWKKRLEPVEKAIERVQERLAPYLKAKEDEKRRAAEEKARKAQEEADRKLKEAQEKERIAREAQEAAEKEAARAATEAARKLKEQQEEAERKRKEAEAEAKRIADEAEAKLKAAQDEIDRLNKEKADADAAMAAKVLKDEEDKKAEAALKQRRKEAEERAKAAAKDVKSAAREGAEIVKAADKEIRQDSKDVRAEIAQDDEAFSELRIEAKEASREANRALDGAVRADKDHKRAEKQTLAGTAELSRTRGDGSVASVSEKWTCDIQDRDELLKSAAEIWDHIPFEALEQAGRSWVRANEQNRVLRGLIIYQETKVGVR